MGGSGTISPMSGGCCHLRPDWGYRIHFQDGSLIMLLSGGFSSSCEGVSIKLLECPCDMAGHFP